MDHFQLSWSSGEEFGDNVQTAWRDLELENDFYDVTIACADNQVKAHKVIISSGSLVLRNILKQNLSQNPVIYLMGLQHSDLQNLVTFIYQGKVSIPQEDLDNFLAIADDLKIRGIYKSNTFTDDQRINECDKSNLDYLQEYNEDTNIGTNVDDLMGNEMEQTQGDNIFESKDTLSKVVYEQKMKTQYEIDLEASDQDNDCKNLNNRKQMKINQNDLSEKDNNVLNNSLFVNKNEDVVNKERKKIVLEGDKIINPLQCNICDKKYVEKLAFKRHTSKVHEIIVHICEQCDYQASTKSDLDKHNSFSHERVLFPCDKCDYKSSTKPKLKEHINTIHERIKKFSCDQCDYKSNLNGNLKKHKKSVHEHIRYSCDQCDLSFAQKQRLVLHIRHQCKK